MTGPAPLIGICLILGLSAAVPLAGRQPARTTDGVYTAAQADRGRTLYRQHCTYCHHDDLLGGEDLRVIPPALIGFDFTDRWVGKTLGAYFDVVSSTMPWERRRLEPAVYADIVAYLLHENGYQPGAVELTPDAARLATITIAPTP